MDKLKLEIELMKKFDYHNIVTYYDIVKTARTLHLSYRRAKFMLDRWNSGLSSQIPNSGEDAKIWLIMSRLEELVTDYEANNRAKLNTVLAKSDLVLPGDD